jgi:ceramide glucosyltransferase
MATLFVALLAASTGWIVLGLISMVRITRATPAPKAPSPPVTILKPLCGAEQGLEQNLESFFELDYPHYELLFGVDDPSDPAVLVVTALRARHPRVEARLIVHGNAPVRRALNPKVDNLMRLVAHAQHDLVLISDSNVRAPRGYLGDMVATMSGDTGVVTNLFAGTGERSLGSALENVQVTGFCAAGAALPTCFGDACVIGKSMLFSREVFASLGGFERVAGVLAEDFVIGKLFQHGGYRVRIARTVLANVTSGTTLGAFVARQQRWALLRWRLRPMAYLLEPIASPLAMAPFAVALFGWSGLGWAAAMALLRDVGGWLILRGSERLWLPLVVSPLREVAMFLVWLRAPLKRHVSWRGNRVRLGAGTLLFPVRKSPPLRRAA